MTRSSPSIRQRLDALSLLDWGFLTAGITSGALAVLSVYAALEGAAGVAEVVVFGLFSVVSYGVVREAVRPEVADECQECGRALVVDSARDSSDTAVTVQQSGEPTRRRVGPLSVILERDRDRGVYCSAVCVRRHLGALEPRDRSVTEPMANRLEGGREVRAS